MSSAFLASLADRNTDPAGRRWLYVPYDQLSGRIGPLSREDPRELGIVLVDSPWKAARRPYHRQKLALVMCNQRRFALEQAERGVAVRYAVPGRVSYREALRPLIGELGPMRVAEPAERELRVDLRPLVDSGGLEVVEHEGWLTTTRQFGASGRKGKAPWKMDSFYRRVRKETGILMEGDKPAGGSWSFDAENRSPWRGDPEPATPPTFPVDDIKEEVASYIESSLPHHPGRLHLESIPASQREADLLWDWAKTACLPTFGPYEDAMSVRSRTLFHTRASALINLSRLLPRTLVQDAEGLAIPIASKEGFIRQILGWREFIRHVHRETDGLRSLGPEGGAADRPGDGGFASWSGKPWEGAHGRGDPDGGARPNRLGAHAPLPAAYWGTTSGLECLDRVVADVWDEGYSHHITRLMVLSNIASLLDIDPRELTDWFWSAYTDAYDWVVEPNVLGMGTYALGDTMITKPYVSGAAYIDRMSDYCAGCRFHPKKDCPITRLYWAFLARHEEKLSGNPRLKLPMASMRKRPDDTKELDAEVFRQVRQTLAAGQILEPEALTKATETAT